MFAENNQKLLEIVKNFLNIILCKKFDTYFQEFYIILLDHFINNCVFSFEILFMEVDIF